MGRLHMALLLFLLGCGDQSNQAPPDTVADTSLDTVAPKDAPVDPPEAGPETAASDLVLPVCGDGVVAPDEDCDDGALDPGDGCDDACQVEKGWYCEGFPSYCYTSCGDGLRGGDEACDDGAQDPGDGCDESCQLEQGWSCKGDPSMCEPICGDGTIKGEEECDDGKPDPDDGCGADCTIGDGWSCDDEPSWCEPVCGDQQLVGDETCDDANQDFGDGCLPNCKTGWLLSFLPAHVAPLDPQTGMAGDLVVDAIFLNGDHSSDGSVAAFGGETDWGGQRTSIDFFLSESAQVPAPCDGLVIQTLYQQEDDDYEVWLVCDANPELDLSLDHVRNLEVEQGDAVQAGDPIGTPGMVEPFDIYGWYAGPGFKPHAGQSFGVLELSMGGSDWLSPGVFQCPAQFLAPELQPIWAEKMAQYQADTETFIAQHLPQLSPFFPEQEYPLPACMSLDVFEED